MFFVMYSRHAALLCTLASVSSRIFAASILPLSTAYTVCEGLGFESGIGRKFAEAPFFYWLYTLLIIAGGSLVLAGILERQADELKSTYAPYTVLEVADTVDGWVLMTASL